MKAVVLKGKLQVKTEEVPVPTIQEPTDVIIKVSQAGLCGQLVHGQFGLKLTKFLSGSDLHQYRGEAPYGFIMGHEVVGDIVEAGSAIKKFKLGDRVLAPFCTSCGKRECCGER